MKTDPDSSLITPKSDQLTRRLAPQHRLNPDQFPSLQTVSAAFVYQFLPIPNATPPVEYVHVPIAPGEVGDLAWISRWNMAWEAGHLRPMLFDEEEVPERFRRLDRFEGRDLRLVPDTGAGAYAAYEALYHLLPLPILQRFGLPPLLPGVWPALGAQWLHTPVLPDLKERLSRALAAHVWPYLSRSPATAFTETEPAIVLAHSLDYWLPFIDAVAQQRMRVLGRVAIADDKQRETWLRLKENAENEEFTPQRPLFGGSVWTGEEDARDATEEMVELADREGQLFALLDAVKSHRVHDDFSPRWSYAREDFERKMYRKRAKVRVAFVEVHDTVPVHGPDAEVEAELIWQDLFALLDPRERRVVVCLRSGTTALGDIARELGYANHSPISKTLSRIRKKASKLLT